MERYSWTKLIVGMIIVLMGLAMALAAVFGGSVLRVRWWSAYVVLVLEEV